MRESWTDDRMDDLSAKVDRVDADVRGLRVEMKTEFAAVRGEMRERFEKVDERFDKIDERFEKADERFDKLEDRFDKLEDRFETLNGRLLQIYQTMLAFCSVALAALIGLIATQI